MKAASPALSFCLVRRNMKDNMNKIKITMENNLNRFPKEKLISQLIFGIPIRTLGNDRRKESYNFKNKI